jgi:hypothetical protein
MAKISNSYNVFHVQVHGIHWSIEVNNITKQKEYITKGNQIRIPALLTGSWEAGKSSIGGNYLKKSHWHCKGPRDCRDKELKDNCVKSQICRHIRLCFLDSKPQFFLVRQSRLKSPWTATLQVCKRTTAATSCSLSVMLPKEVSLSPSCWDQIYSPFVSTQCYLMVRFFPSILTKQVTHISTGIYNAHGKHLGINLLKTGLVVVLFLKSKSFLSYRCN